MTSLWLTAVRRRPVIFVLLLLVGTLAVASAVAVPLLTRAVGQAALVSATGDDSGADLRERSFTLTAQLGDNGLGYADASSRTRRLLDLSASPVGMAAAPYWSAPKVAIVSTENVEWRSGKSSTLVSRWITADTTCSLYVLADGRCPERDDEVLVPTSAVPTTGAAVGRSIRFELLRGDRTTRRVVGHYDPDRSGGAPLVRPGSTAGQVGQVTADPLVVTEPGLEDDVQGSARVIGRLDLLPGLDLDGLPIVRGALQTLRDRVGTQDVLYSIDTGIDDLLDRAEAQLQAGQTLIQVSGVEAAVLAIAALVTMASQLGRVRAAEWGIGRLQGVARARWWSVVYLEPLVPLLLGVPAGIAVVYGVGRWLVGRTLTAGTGVELFRIPILVAATATGAVAALALIVIALPALRRPLADLIQRRTEASQPGRFAVAAQSIMLVLAAVAGYQVTVGGVLGPTGSRLGLLAPGLFAMAAALLAVRLSVVIVRQVTRRRPRGTTGLLVARRIARIPSVLQPSLILTVAVALAVLSTQVAVLSLRNQALRADATVGATTVLPVRGAVTATALQDAVAAADPTGRYAMAAQETGEGEFGGANRIIAVDSERLAAVSRWQLDWSNVADLPAALRGTPQSPLVLRGRQLTVQLTKIDIARNYEVYDPTPPQAPGFSITVADSNGWSVIGLGTLPDQQSYATFTASLPTSCADGCRLVSFALQTSTSSAYSTTLTISSISTDQQPASATADWLRDPQRWKPASSDTTADAPGSVQPTVGADGLDVVAVTFDSMTPQTVRSADVADPLPVLLSPGAAPPPVQGPGRLVRGTGLDGQAQLLAPIGTAAVLPRSLGDGVLVDLATVTGLSDPAASEASSEVWLTDDAPADLPARLAAAGLRLGEPERLSTVADRLAALPMTRGAVVAAGIGSTGLVLALIALIAGRAIDTQQRRADWQTARRMGLSTRQVRRLATVEIAAPALIGVLLGLAAGLAGLAISVPRLPLVDLATAGPPLDLTPSPTLLAGLGLGSVAVVLIVAIVAATIETREGPS